MQYVVSSSTRVGSHYLCWLIEKCAVKCIKTHNPLLVTDYALTTLCLLKRKDVFAAIMSTIITSRTQEFRQYSHMPIEPFFADLQEVDNSFHDHYFYEPRHDFTRPYAKVVTFVFEDILQDPSLVYDTLRIKPRNRIQPIPQSPYRYQDIILNHKECKERYQFWCENYGI